MEFKVALFAVGSKGVAYMSIPSLTNGILCFPNVDFPVYFVGDFIDVSDPSSHSNNSLTKSSSSVSVIMAEPHWQIYAPVIP